MKLYPENVCTTIVANNLCIGCGVCTGICPTTALEMKFNEFGEYVPIEIEGRCLPTCNLCNKSCPFDDEAVNEDLLAQTRFSELPGILHKKETGYYLKSYVGYSKIGNFRLSGSSGGITSWLLETLLSKAIVDKVICVVENLDPGKQFRFTVLSLDNVEELHRNGGSCYYPVEMSDVIREILTHEDRYAVVGLPCFIKGIRLAMTWNPKLKRRVHSLIGLVCGQSKSKFFLEFLTASMGENPENLIRSRFRTKDPSRPASDFALKVELNNNKKIEQKRTFFSEGMVKVWTSGMFKVNACNYCDDVFGETADIVLMDAWLPEYEKDYRGHNLIINRSPVLEEILENGATSGEISLESIGINRVIESQVAVLEEKHLGLKYRLAIAQQNSEKTPNKRVAAELVGNWFDHRIWKIKKKVGRISRETWSQERNYKVMRKKIWGLIFQLDILVFTRNLVRVFQQRRFGKVLKNQLGNIFANIQGKPRNG